MSDSVRVLQVIETTIGHTGNGVSADDPFRHIRQYWTLDGDLLATVDEWQQPWAEGLLEIRRRLTQVPDVLRRPSDFPDDLREGLAKRIEAWLQGRGVTRGTKSVTAGD